MEMYGNWASRDHVEGVGDDDDENETFFCVSVKVTSSVFIFLSFSTIPCVCFWDE